MSVVRFIFLNNIVRFAVTCVGIKTSLNLEGLITALEEESSFRLNITMELVASSVRRILSLDTEIVLSAFKDLIPQKI